MKSEKHRCLAALGGLSGAAYLASIHAMPGVPDLLLGLLLGLGLALIAMGLLPEETWMKLRKWKHRGE